MAERTLILLMDENLKEREHTAAVLRESVPCAEIHEVATGLDYALELTRPVLDVAIAAPSFSWGDGRELLQRVRRHHPECATILLGSESSAPLGVTPGMDIYHKSPRGLTELAQALGRVTPSRLPVESRVYPRETEIEPVAQSDPYDHLRSELEHVHRLAERVIADDLLAPYPKQQVTLLLRATERLAYTVAYLFGDESGRKLELGPVNLADAVLVAMRGLQPALQTTGARVLAGRLPVLMADQGSLVMLFHHLIENAIKFRDTHAPRITVRAHQAGNEWLILVEDNGRGMPAGAGTTIFEMFQRGPETRHIPGTGVGLSICRRIARQYEGDIAYSANREGGTTFTVTLRVRSVESPAVDLSVQCNGRGVGRIRTRSNADKNEITREALGLPALNQAIGDLTIKDVQLLENQVVNIVV